MISLALAAALALSHPADQVITRATFDIGSGSAKILVADVYPLTGKISRVWHKSAIPIDLRRDLQEGYLSDEVGDRLIRTIVELQQRALPFNPTEWVAVGTSVFRTAKNGQTLLDRVLHETSLNVLLLPHDKEGEMGNKTAAVASQLPQEEIVSCDFGAGSFQISTFVEGKLEIYKEEFGTATARHMLYDIRKETFTNETPNPITKEEAEQLIHAIKSALPPLPNWLKGNEKKLLSIGGLAVVRKVIGKPTYTIEDVKEAYQKLLNKTDSDLNIYQLEQPEKAVLKLIYLYAIMEHCHFDEITYCATQGICEGLLVSEEFWHVAKESL